MSIAYWLSELVPQSGLIADFPLDSLRNVVGLTDTDTVADYSGNARDLIAPGNPVPVEQNSLNGRPSLNFSGSELLQGDWGGVLAKHIFIVTKYDAAVNFGGSYRGLLTGADGAAVSVLVGDNAASSTKFKNFAFGGTFGYKKSQASYIESNQQAPFSNFELIEVSLSTGFLFDIVQLGQQTNNATRRWIGRVPDLKLYTAVLMANDLRKLHLYYDLKFGLWLTAGTTLEFPDPTLTGIRWRRFKEIPLDWSTVTDDYEYEDGGKDFNDRTDTPAVEWEIGFQGLTRAQLDIFDQFNKMARMSRTFSFIDKWGVSHSNVRIKSYESNHDDYKSWRHFANFRLCQYP